MRHRACGRGEGQAVAALSFGKIKHLVLPLPRAGKAVPVSPCSPHAACRMPHAHLPLPHASCASPPVAHKPAATSDELWVGPFSVASGYEQPSPPALPHASCATFIRRESRPVFSCATACRMPYASCAFCLLPHAACRMPHAHFLLPARRMPLAAYAFPPVAHEPPATSDELWVGPFSVASGCEQPARTTRVSCLPIGAA